MSSLNRDRLGSTLITVIGIGLVSSLWLSALMGVVLPSYNRASAGRTEIALRSACEAGLDWAVAGLNTAGSALEDPVEDSTPGPLTEVPTSVLGEYGMNTRCSVQVSNQRPPAGSYVYDPTLDPSQVSTNGGVATNGWRMVSSTATCGRLTKTIRVLLKPTYTTSPTFDYALFGRSNVTLNGYADTDSYDSSIGWAASYRDLDGNVGSNTRVDLIGNADVGGDVRVFSNPPGGTAQVVSGTANVNIEGSLLINGTINSSGGSADFDSSNVEGRLASGLTSPNPIQTQLQAPQKQLPAAPSAPVTAIDLGAIQVAGNNEVVLQAPGDYIVSSLQITGNGKVRIQGTGAVKLFIQGATSNIGIAGNGIVHNGRPQDFQLYYNGTGKTTIAGNGTYKGVIYAPNSDIAISGNGDVYGSVVGNTITSSSDFHYDRSLATLNPVTAMTLTRMQTVSWQEL